MTAVAADGGVYHPPAIPMAVSNTGVTATALSLAASASTDVFAITSNGDGNTIITQNGTTIEDEPTENILAPSITGGAESVSINFTNGDPLPIGGIFTDANVELDGPHGTDPLVTTATAAYIGSDEIRYAANTTLTDHLTSDGGILAIDGTTNLNNPAGDSLTVAPGATVFVNGNQTFSSLTIDAGATVRQISQDTTLGDTVITVGSLEIENPDGSGNGGGVLDLGNGDLIVRDTAASEIQPLLAAGYDGGLWDGEVTSGPNPAAIISSAAASDPLAIKSLGYAQIGSTGNDLNSTTYDGESVASGDVVVALTYYGDANLDRQVNSTDLAIMNASSGGATPDVTISTTLGWEDGDFNYDGKFNDLDATLFNNGVIMLGATTGVCLEVHEPGSTKGTTTLNSSGGTIVIVTGYDVHGDKQSLAGQTVSVAVSGATPLPPGASISIASQGVNLGNSIQVVLTGTGLTPGVSYTVLITIVSSGGTTYTSGSIQVSQ